MRTAPALAASIAFICLLAAGVALANPISLEAFRVKAVPGTMHVQVTWGVAKEGPGKLVTPTELLRDGKPVAASWLSLDGGFTANTGSGLASLHAVQTCDCDVPLGQHKWEVTVKGYEWKPSASLAVGLPVEPPDAGTTDHEDAGSAGDVAAEVFPWEIPEPAGIQGLDCTKVCVAGPKPDVAEPDTSQPEKDATSPLDSATAPPPADAALADQGAVVAKDADSAPPTTSAGRSSSCQGSGAAAPSGALLVLLGLGLVIVRRRLA